MNTAPHIGADVLARLYDHGPGHYRTVRARVIGHAVADDRQRYPALAGPDVHVLAVLELHPSSPAHLGSTIVAHPDALELDGHLNRQEPTP